MCITEICYGSKRDQIDGCPLREETSVLQNTQPITQLNLLLPLTKKLQISVKEISAYASLRDCSEDFPRMVLFLFLREIQTLVLSSKGEA